MTNPIYYNRVVTSTVQGDGYNVIEPTGTLIVANGGELRLHDGSTAGGVSVGSGGGGSNLISSFGTDQGVGSTYLTGNPVLFTNDDILIRTGGTAASGSGGSGQMYIMSAEDITIGTATDPATLTDATSGVTCDAKVYIIPAHSNGGTSSTVSITAGSNTLSVDSVGGLTYNSSAIAGGIPAAGATYTLNSGANLVINTTSGYINFLNNAVTGVEIGDTTRIYANNQYAEMQASGTFAIPGTLASGTTTGAVVVNSNDGTTTRTWTFGTDGSLAIPQSNSGAAVINSGSNGMQFIANSNSWQFGTGGNLVLPVGGTITEGSSPAGAGHTITLTPYGGSDANQQLLIYPTITEGNHLHLTSGALGTTSLFLGNDNQYIRTNTDGSMVIGTDDTIPDQTNSGYRWTFGTDGKLSLPRNNVITAEGNAQVGYHITVTDNFTLEQSAAEEGNDNSYVTWDAGASSFVSQIWTPFCVGQPDAMVGWTMTSSDNVVTNVVAANNYGLAYTIKVDAYNIGASPWTFQSPNYVAASDNTVNIKSADKHWTFGTDGSLTFPDLSQQKFTPSIGVGPLHPYAAPFPSGSGVIGTDYQFYFDIGNNGYPSMQSYTPTGGNPLYESVWSIEYWTAASSSANPSVSSSGPTPVQVNNTGGVLLVPETLAPGDYAVVRIQNIDTGRVYRATFLGSYNAADEGNETKYGSIIIERLV